MSNHNEKNGKTEDAPQSLIEAMPQMMSGFWVSSFKFSNVTNFY